LKGTAGKILPSVLFVNINGSGMGHMTTCLGYANRLRGRARPVFFSMTSAVEMIEAMGFEADYFVSQFWSRSRGHVWNRQLAMRLGMMFERVRPAVIVFDGPEPYPGFMDAVRAWGKSRLVWSDLVLFREGAARMPVRESEFDLLIRLGELGSHLETQDGVSSVRRVQVPPVTVLRDEELLDRAMAREALGLKPDGRYALFSLGPGNLKNVSTIGHGLIEEFSTRGYTVVWTHAPITVKDTPLPDGVVPISVYPLARYMRAFDVFVGAAGYNACCEVIQAGVPALFVPNREVIDDQTARARKIAGHLPAVVSPCETASERAEAVERLLALPVPEAKGRVAFDLDGAEHAADEILALARQEVG
jgi:UDP:flavonoid glycosyltransferase YjiC (YdhE family)